jgi:hypothetical protein
MTAEQWKESQKQYAFEQNRTNEQFDLGLNQWQQEQNAAEDQSKFQADYQKQQDIIQAAQAEADAKASAQYDYANYQLQGQQAGAGLFSQGAAYTTNLSEGERANANTWTQWQQANPTPSSTQNTISGNVQAQTNALAQPRVSYNMPQPTQKTTTQQYALPKYTQKTAAVKQPTTATNIKQA